MNILKEYSLSICKGYYKPDPYLHECVRPQEKTAEPVRMNNYFFFGNIKFVEFLFELTVHHHDFNFFQDDCSTD